MVCRSTSESVGEQKRLCFIKVAGLLLLIAAILINFDRLRYEKNELPYMCDFKLVWAACQVARTGGNPYDSLSLQYAWNSIARKENLNNRDAVIQSGPFMYPPYVVHLFSLFILLPWRIAAFVALILSVIFLGGTIALIAALGKYLSKPYELLLLGMIIAASKEAHHAVIIGQPLIASLFFSVASIYLSQKKRNWFAALSLCIGLIKPTVALPFFLYLLVSGKYRIVILSGILAGIANIVSLHFLPIDSLATCFSQVHLSMQPGRINDYSPINYQFFNLTGIETLLSVVITSREGIAIIKYVLLLSAIIGYCIVSKVKRNKGPYFSLIYFIFISLFFLYHRFADTLMLCVIMAGYRPSRLANKLRYFALLLLPFFFPFTGAIKIFKDKLPFFAYHLLSLNAQWAMLILFILWISDQVSNAEPESRDDKVVLLDATGSPPDR
jgi:hypothetical protein